MYFEDCMKFNDPKWAFFITSQMDTNDKNKINALSLSQTIKNH